MNAQFTAHDIAQAITAAQAITERVAYQGKAARKEQHEYTVKAVSGKGRAQVQIIDHYIAYDEADAMSQFNDDYGIRATSAYRTKLAK